MSGKGQPAGRHRLQPHRSDIFSTTSRQAFIMPANTRQKGFLDLPNEIRASVYKALWAGTEIELVFDRNTANNLAVITLYKGPANLNILQICRIVYNEAILVLMNSCSLNLWNPQKHFKLGAYQYPPCDFARLVRSTAFPRRLQQAMSCMQKVTLRLDLSEYQEKAGDWFPIRDQLACFPKLNFLEIVDVDGNATMTFLTTAKGYKENPNDLTEGATHPALGEVIEKMFNRDASLKSFLQKELRKAQRQPLKIVLRLALRFFYSSVFEPLIPYATYENDDLLDSWDAWMNFRFDFFDRRISEVSYSMVSQTLGHQIFPVLSDFLARLKQIHERNESGYHKPHGLWQHRQNMLS